MKDLLALHLDADMEDSCAINVEDTHEVVEVLQNVTVEDVTRELSRINVILSPEQNTYVRDMASKRHCMACAGSGKTTVASGVVAAFLKILDSLFEKEHIRRLVVWLTPNREQRDEVCHAVRRVLENPTRAAGLGRPTGAASSCIEDITFDAATEKVLAAKLAPLQEKLDTIEAKCLELESNGDMDFAVRRQTLELYYRTSCELRKEKEAVLEESFKNVDVLCLTIDGFLQLVSGKSALSYLINNVIIQLAIVDEAHQLEATKVAAVACCVQEMLTFFDQAQVVDCSCNTRFRKRQVRGQRACNEKCVYNWARCAGIEAESVERLWDFLPDEALNSLSVSWRCGADICSEARATSIAYGVAESVEYAPGKSIYCADELPGFDNSDKEKHRKHCIVAFCTQELLSMQRQIDALC